MKNYTAPWLDVIEFSAVDIIATSKEEEEGDDTVTEATTTEENKSPWA